ncbi:MAG: MBL fold metallo-hydrolase [Anaerolineae bacterium]
MIVDTLVLGLLQTNCYLVGDEESAEALVIDPAAEHERILDALSLRGWSAAGIVATHGDFDHVLAAAAVKEATSASFQLHRGDEDSLHRMQENAAAFLGVVADAPPEVDGYLEEGDELRFGGSSLGVLWTPGHTPGSVSLYDGEGSVFSGDALFSGSVGRTDLPGGDLATLIASIREKLLILGDEVTVYPGHGPATTVGRERRFNAFLTSHLPHRC